MKIAILDGANLLHRARFGFSNRVPEQLDRPAGKEDFSVVYGFFRSLRPLVAECAADKVYLTLEGRPTQQLDLLPEYKSNRVTLDPKKLASMADFNRQKQIVTEILADFPIHVAQHPNFEGDDVVGAIACHMHSTDDVRIVSSDTDFIQLLQRHGSCTLYNPVSKSFRQTPEYDYVTWKALRGDAGDGIPGIPGIGDKRAEVMARSEELRNAFLQSNPEHMETYTRNVALIGLTDMSAQLEEIQISVGAGNLTECRRRFWEMGFKSIAEAIPWSKFVSTFKGLQ